MDTLVALYLDGQSVSNLSRIFGQSQYLCRKALKEAGVYSPGRDGIDRAEAVRLYATGQSTTDIARGLGFSVSCVQRALKAEGVSLPPVGTGNRMSGDCDHGFFSTIDTEEKAYWLGFLQADGNVIKNTVRIELGKVDVEHVYRFQEALSSRSTTVTHSTGEGRNGGSVKVGVTSPQLVQDLARLGVLPNKSHTTVPIDVGPDLERHYWRGLVDGDGWLTMRGPRRNNGEIAIGFCGTPELVCRFADIASRHGRRPKIVTTRNPQQAIVSARDAVMGLGHWLYDDHTVALPRKACKWDEFVVWYEQAGPKYARRQHG